MILAVCGLNKSILLFEDDGNELFVVDDDGGKKKRLVIDGRLSCSLAQSRGRLERGWWRYITALQDVSQFCHP
jgi:hypothetical protein